MTHLQEYSKRLLHMLEWLMAIGLFAILLTVITQVVLSSCFNSSITGANELMTKLFVYITSIGAAVAVGRDEHIEITCVADRMSPRVRRLLDVMVLTSVGLLNAVVVIYSFHWIAVTGEYLMPATQLPRMTAQLSIPIGSSLAVLYCLLNLLFGRDKHRQETTH